MDCAIRPERFANDQEWTAWKQQYQREYRELNKERKKLVSMGMLPKRRRTHAKKRLD